jgi:hypothetical protein
MTSSVTIGRRFVGPPDSANGGYACGLVAQALTSGPAEVTLRHPPPVDRPLGVVLTPDQAALYDGDRLIAESRAAEPVVDLPAPVSFADAERAAEGFDEGQYAARHHYPGCFGCGPRRDPGDGLRIFPVAVGPRRVVWPWIPDASLTGKDGLVGAALIWAALDCTSGLAWYHDRPPASPHVLGRMTAAIHRRPAAGERLVAAGWAIGQQDWKRHSGSVIWAADGEVLARNVATWIVLDGRQRAVFRPAGRTD